MGDRHYEHSEHPYDAQQQALDHESYAMQRSITHGSHNTYASNQSWAPPSIHGASVMSETTQQTPFYGPRQPPQRRPLPNYPATYSYTENHSRQDEAEYIEEDYSAQEQPQENYGYEDQGYYQQPEEQQHDYYAHHDIPPPEPIPVPQPNEYLTSPQLSSILGPNKKKTFVGGFVKGFRRVFAGKKGIERRKIERKNTFGTDASGTATITHATEGNTRPGNAIPHYLSNPSIGPSNPQFAHRLSMAPVATPVPPFNPPPILMPTSPPQQIPGEFPGVMVTPPSEGDEDRRSDEMLHYNGASQAGGEHSYYEEQDLQRRYNPQPPEDPRNRTTYVPYSNPTGTVATESQYNPPPTSRAPTIPQSLPYIPSMTVTSPVIPTFPPDPPPPRQNTRRVSYAATPLPSRRREDQHGMFQPGEPEQHTPYATPPRTPNRPRGASQDDYEYEQSMQRRSEMQGPTPTRRRQVNSGPPPRYLPAPTRRPSRSQNRQSSGKNMLSPETVYTTTSGVVSMYDPSFASHLTPIEKFFKGLYNLPWIASRRVTVDYRPPEGKKAFRTSRGFSSWYRSVGQRSKASIDAMSETISSGGMSVRNSVQLLTSPLSRRNRNTVEGGMGSNRDWKRESSTAKSRHRERRRRRRETMETVNTAPTHRSASPIVPPVYPFQYPSFPYLLPYGAYPSPQMYPTTAPRGPRHHGRRRRERQQEQSYGYQSMAAPPGGAPMYVFASPQGDGGYHQFPGAVPHYPGAPVSPGYVSYGGYSTSPPGMVPVYQPFPRSVSDG